MPTNPLEPALTLEEWTAGPRRPRVEMAARLNVVQVRERDQYGREYSRQQVTVEDTDIPALIALANAALPDTDPRKITWEWIDELRAAALDVDDTAASDRLNAMADALASYLPPEAP